MVILFLNFAGAGGSKNIDREVTKIDDVSEYLVGLSLAGPSNILKLDDTKVHYRNILSVPTRVRSTPDVSCSSSIINEHC